MMLYTDLEAVQSWSHCHQNHVTIPRRNPHRQQRQHAAGGNTQRQLYVGEYDITKLNVTQKQPEVVEDNTSITRSFKCHTTTET